MYMLTHSHISMFTIYSEEHTGKFLTHVVTLIYFHTHMVTHSFIHTNILTPSLTHMHMFANILKPLSHTNKCTLCKYAQTFTQSHEHTHKFIDPETQKYKIKGSR